MTSGSWLKAAAAVLLAVSSFQWFPGHSWLQSDTQIYAPILLHLENSAVLSQDFLVSQLHVSYTIYDEVALWMRRATRGSLESGLFAVQAATRTLAVAGIWMVLESAGLTASLALAGAAIFSLGGWIYGPSVLLVEFEPVPRGFAVSLLLFGLGWLAKGQWRLCGLSVSAALLFHPPTVWPFLPGMIVAPLALERPQRRAAWGGLFEPLLAGVAILLLAARLQSGAGEAQDFWVRLTHQQEMLQRMRASYVWVSAWILQWGWHYAVWTLVACAAWKRASAWLPAPLRLQIGLLGVSGLASIPASWMLLETAKWGLVPQLQPLRALLFLIVSALVLLLVAAFHALSGKRGVEGAVWLFFAFSICCGVRFTAGFAWRPALAALALSAGTAAGISLVPRGRLTVLAQAALTAVFLAAMPWLAGARAAEVRVAPEIQTLSYWARGATGSGSVFLFADAGESTYPGVFRTVAQRAVYVDWKSGGQVNYLRKLGEEWWTRWQAVQGPCCTPQRLEQLGGLGIGYVVLERRTLAGQVPIYWNQRFTVYATSVSER